MKSSACGRNFWKPLSSKVRSSHKNSSAFLEALAGKRQGSELSEVENLNHLLVTLSFSGIKLREANQQQQFNRNVEDIELWLYEVEGHLASDDYGKDLTSVQNLQKKHALLEADVAAHQVRGIIFLPAL